MNGQGDVGEVGPAITIAVVLSMLAGLQIMRWRTGRTSTVDSGGRMLLFAVGFALLAAGSLVSLADREAGSVVNGIGLLAVLAGVVVSYVWRRRSSAPGGDPPPRPDQAASEEDDPGWRPALDLLRFGFLVLPALRKRPSLDGLIALRFIFLSYVAAMFLYGVAFSYISQWPGRPRMLHIAVVFVGMLSTAFASRNARRPLILDSPGSLVGSYRSRMWIGMGIAQIPALVSLAATFVARGLWIYVVGLAFALVNLWRIAPSPRHLAEDQAAITAAGSTLSLVAALRAMPPSER